MLMLLQVRDHQYITLALFFVFWVAHPISKKNMLNFSFFQFCRWTIISICLYTSTHYFSYLIMLGPQLDCLNIKFSGVISNKEVCKKPTRERWLLGHDIGFVEFHLYSFLVVKNQLFIHNTNSQASCDFITFFD